MVEDPGEAKLLTFWLLGNRERRSEPERKVPGTGYSLQDHAPKTHSLHLGPISYWRILLQTNE